MEVMAMSNEAIIIEVGRSPAPPSGEGESSRPFDDPNFAQRLVEHLHRAKRKAIAEAQEAGQDDCSTVR
jgi:hypothetical protein